MEAAAMAVEAMAQGGRVAREMEEGSGSESGSGSGDLDAPATPPPSLPPSLPLSLPPSTPPSMETDDGLGAGAIVGIICGVLGAVALLAGLVFFQSKSKSGRPSRELLPQDNTVETELIGTQRL